MYALGMPVTVTIDDFLPLISTRETIYASVSRDGALWGPILEKAYAKLIGNYEALNGGLIGPGIETITGYPYQDLHHDSRLSPDTLWDLILEHRSRNGIITGGSHYSEGGDSMQNDVGISYSHAYTILDAVELSSGDRLVAVANPWGLEFYHGPWSDTSGQWTDELRREANHESGDDGRYFMPIEGWMESMAYTTFSHDSSGWHHSSFLVLDDTYDNEKYSPLCSSYFEPCTLHKFKVFSKAKQTIKLIAHVWQDTFYFGECYFDAPINHTVYVPKTGNAYDLSFGSINGFGDIEVEADEKVDVHMYMNWGAAEGIGRDFSLTVYSDVEPVRVVHMGGLISDEWTVTERGAEVSPSDGGSSPDQSEAEQTQAGEQEPPAAEEGAGPADERDYGTYSRDELIEMLTDWARDQEAYTKGWSCRNTIFVDFPFGEEYMAVWSNHNCKTYDLYLTILLDLDGVNGYLMHAGQDLTTAGCMLSYTDYDWNVDDLALYECEFYIPAGGENFAILFKGRQNIFYMERWESVSGGWW